MHSILIIRKDIEPMLWPTINDVINNKNRKRMVTVINKCVSGRHFINYLFVRLNTFLWKNFY